MRAPPPMPPVGQPPSASGFPSGVGGGGVGVVKMENLEAASRQLARNAAYGKHGPGVCTATGAHSKFIAVGTSRGLILLFDHFQVGWGGRVQCLKDGQHGKRVGKCTVGTAPKELISIHFPRYSHYFGAASVVSVIREANMVRRFSRRRGWLRSRPHDYGMSGCLPRQLTYSHKYLAFRRVSALPTVVLHEVPLQQTNRAVFLRTGCCILAVRGIRKVKIRR